MRISRYYIYIPLIIFSVLMFILWKGLSLNPGSYLRDNINTEKHLPNFRLPLVSDVNKIITEKELIGKVGLLHVWATWCSVCLQEHTELLTLQNKYTYPIYGLSYKDDPLEVNQWLLNQGDPFVYSFVDMPGHLGFELGIYGTPETFVLDKFGSIRFRHVGMLTVEIFEKQLLPILQSLDQEMKA